MDVLSAGPEHYPLILHTCVTEVIPHILHTHPPPSMPHPPASWWDL